MLKDGKDIIQEKASKSGNKLTIAFSIYRLGKSTGGAERVAYEMAKRIAGKGHELHVFSHHFRDVSDLEAVLHTVPVSKNPYFLKRHSFAKNLDSMLSEHSFDIIQSFTRTLRCDVYRFGSGIHRKYLSNTKKSLLSRVFSKINPKHIAENILEKKSLSPDAYKVIVAVSNIEKESLINTYSVSEDRIKVIYNGVDINKFTNTERKERKERFKREFRVETDFNVLFCGTGFSRKGLDQAIKAIYLSIKRGLKLSLVIIGRGHYEPYKSLVRKLGITDSVLYLGHRVHMEKYYPAFDAFILPTRFDPFPNSCLEAMACGTPVITSKNTGVGEIIENGKESFLLSSPESADEAADLLTRLYKDMDLWSSVSENARIKAEKYNWDNVIDKYIDLYQEVSNNNPVR